MKFSSTTCALFAICLLLMVSAGASAQSELASFRSYNYPKRYIRHTDWNGWISEIATPLDSKDAQFRIVPGLANRQCSSFESTNFRGHFLRHANSRLVLSKAVDEKLFREDATFCREWSALSETVQGIRAEWFRSFNFPDRYIRHRDFALWVERNDGSAGFKRDATFFVVRPKLAPVSQEGDTVGIPAKD